MAALFTSALLGSSCFFFDQNPFQSMADLITK